MAEQEVQGIALGLTLDTAGFSQGISRAKAELESLQTSAKNLSVTVPITRRRVAADASVAAISANVSPAFNVTRGAVRDLRIGINSQLRALAASGESIAVPIKVGRIPYATLRSEISRGIGEVPITVRLAGVSGAGRSALTALLTEGGASVGQAVAHQQAASARIGAPIPKRALGGPVGGNWTLVGERGPELVRTRGGGGYVYPMARGGGIAGNSDTSQWLTNLMAAAGRLQPHNIAGGRDWYRTAHQYAATSAQRFGAPLPMAQGLLAALSVGTEWNSNKTKFEKILAARQAGRPGPYQDDRFIAHRFAKRILGGEDPSQVFATSPKVSQFHRGIMGDLSSLTLDRWATRTMKGWQPGMPTGQNWDRPPKRGPNRLAAEAAWKQAAEAHGLQPAEFQAALWLQEKEGGQLSLGMARGGQIIGGSDRWKGRAYRERGRRRLTGAALDSHQNRLMSDRYGSAGFGPSGHLAFGSYDAQRAYEIENGMDAGPEGDTHYPEWDHPWMRGKGYARGGSVMKAPRQVLGETEETWARRTGHRVKMGMASMANGPRGPRERCHTITKPDEEWPGNRLCHLPIQPDGSGGWRHESFDEFYDRIVPPAYKYTKEWQQDPRGAENRIQKLRAMADQSVSPAEASIAQRMLRSRGVSGYARGGFASRFKSAFRSYPEWDPVEAPTWDADAFARQEAEEQAAREAFRASEHEAGQQAYENVRRKGEEAEGQFNGDPFAGRASQRQRYTTCGLCGEKTRFIGSHVINSHLPYGADRGAVREMLEKEKFARTGVSSVPPRADNRPQVDKLRAMADQTASPNEASIARRILHDRGIPGYAGGGFIRRAYEQTLANQGGTFNRHGIQPGSGYAVAYGQGPVVPAGDPGAFARAFHNVYNAAGRSSYSPFVGTWQTGDEIQLDTATVMGRKRDALRAALKQGQIAGFDLKRFEEIHPQWSSRYPSPGQMRLPGFANGGEVNYRSDVERRLRLHFPTADISLPGLRDQDYEELLNTAPELAGRFPLTSHYLAALRVGPLSYRPLSAGESTLAETTGLTHGPGSFRIPGMGGAGGHPSTIVFSTALPRVPWSKVSDQLTVPSVSGLFAHEFGHAVDFAHSPGGQFHSPSRQAADLGLMPASTYGAAGGYKENFAEAFAGNVLRRGGYPSWQVGELLDRISNKERFFRAGGGPAYGSRRALFGHARAGHGAGEDLRAQAFRLTHSPLGAMNLLDKDFQILTREMEGMTREYTPFVPHERAMSLAAQRARLLRQTRSIDPFQHLYVGLDESEGLGGGSSTIASGATAHGNAVALGGSERWSQAIQQAKGFGFSENANGGDVPPGTYIVGEIGREKFVPKTMEDVIPPDVAAQIPGGGGLAARIAARQAQTAEPWKPEWLRRGSSKDLTRRASGGIVDIPPGPMLWQAPEDGWIIPNRLMNRVPHAAVGATFHGGGFEAGFEADAQRRREEEYERRYQADARARRIAQRIQSALPNQYVGNASLDELRQVRAESIPIGGRTPRTLIGAAAGFVASGEKRRLAEEQYRTSTRELLEFRKALGPDYMSQLTANAKAARSSVLELARAHGKDSDQVTRQLGVYRQAVEVREHAAGAEREQAEALSKIRTGAPDVAKSFLALQGTFAAYQLGLQGVQLAMQIGARTVEPLIDRLTGFGTVTDTVTRSLADITRQNGGNIGAAIAQSAPGVGGTGLSYLTQTLGPGVSARAGGANAQDILKLFEASIGYQSGRSIPGITQGQGGFLGGPIGAEQLGGQIGLSEILSRGAGDYQGAIKNAGQPTLTTSHPGAYGGIVGLISQITGNQILAPGDTLTPGDQSKVDQLGKGFTTYLGTWNDAVKRDIDVMGAHSTGLEVTTAAQAKVTQQQLDAANKLGFGAFGTSVKDAAVILDSSTGQIVTDFAKYQKFLAQAGAGFTLPSRDEFAAQQIRPLQAALQQADLQGSLERGTQLPGQFGLQVAANPFSPAGTGFKFANKAEEAKYGGAITQIQNEQDAITSMADAGIAKQREFISQWTSADLASQFDQDVASIKQYGGAIASLNAEVANAQAGVVTAQYANNIRILNRSFKDAKSLLGTPRASQLTVGANNLGAVQKAEFNVSRASQQLGFQLSQRQINFQTAVAGFQAPGVTGQERAARTEEALAEARVAQKQLDLQKQQFILEGVAFKIEAKRAVADLSASIGLEAQSRDAQLLALKNEKLINANQLRLSKAQADANSIISQASTRYGSVVSAAATYVATFGGTIKTATDDLRKALGLDPLYAKGHTGTQYNNPQASGIVFDTGGPTSITVGEAGSEHVAVLRNPRRMDIGATVPRGGGGGWGGNGPVSIGPFIMQGGGDKVDLDSLARDITDLVERRLGIKARVLGIQSSSTFR